MPKDNIDKLAEAVERASKSGWQMFKQGFLFGLGRGLGTLFIWALVLTLLFSVLDKLGVFESIQQNLNQLEQLRGAFR